MSVSGEIREQSDAQNLRLAALRTAVQAWRGQLVDLSGRNNLIYYRALKRGTLELEGADPDVVEEFLRGRVVALAQLFADSDQHEDAVRRARAVRNKAAEHFEERGLETLFLGCGIATWNNPRGSSTPAAPVLLCPARLAPRGASQREFELSLTGEPEVNPTLLQLLATDFDCAITAERLMEQAGLDGAIDTREELNATYNWLARQAAAVPGFAVVDRLLVGTFSYAKLPMVQDLDGAEEAMLDHDLIAALAGDPGAQEALRSGVGEHQVPGPDSIPPADEFLVLDADASQNYAINAVLGGQNIVIKGPPGTGKSQTIANLIASLLARQRTVLFVAEKRAAIDAVLGRLEHRHLGDLVLDLHGGTASRKKIAKGLADTLSSNRAIGRADHSKNDSMLERRRNELNQRVRALHDTRPPWGLSAYQVMCRLLDIPRSNRVTARFRGQALADLDGLTMERARQELREYVSRHGLDVRAQGRPWSNAEVVSSEQAEKAFLLVDDLQRRTMPALCEQLEQAAATTGLTSTDTLSGWADRLACWEGIAQTLQTFRGEIFEFDLPELLAQLAPLRDGVLKRATASLGGGSFRAARKQVRALLVDGKTLGPLETHTALSQASEHVTQWRAVRKGDTSPAYPESLDKLVRGFARLRDALIELDGFLHSSPPLPDRPAADIRKILESLIYDRTTLTMLPELHKLRTSLELVGLGEFLAELEAQPVNPEAACEMLDFAWLQSILDHVSLTDPAIGTFEGNEHQVRVDEFREADATHIETSAERVRRVCAEHATKAQDDFPDEAQLVRHQAGLSRKHMHVKQLFAAAPHVLTALRPCWAMSPLMVSQILPSTKPYFDVVIFDEASQITPADAIPALLRGRQAVVAGDNHQLPPTSFFATNNPESEDDDAEQYVISAAEGFESILKALEAYVPFRTLQWHYRSRDERLIAFSNAYFYDRMLTTFPGVAGPDCLRHVLVPWRSGEVGSDQSAAAEVSEVVQLILEHARERPTESLGVIAMGIKHANRIEEALRRELSARPELDGFFDETKDEKFFVKNLERVQGDERDAIILSIGYGKSENGRLLYRFGPLNQQGGERRLNVAVTRAKNRMILVSSFGSNDMDPNRSSAEGVKLLRLYLQYAESRGANLGDAALDKPALNPFEIDIRDRLVAAGIPLVSQYGVSGFWIDFAAQHPTQPGRMVLAIECDGATYHSSESARDRDRLRQDKLEDLGWTFHRIWSQDWFQHKDGEVAKAKQAYDAAVSATDEPHEPHDQTPRGVHGASAFDTLRSHPRPYLPRGLAISEYAWDELDQIVRYVESDTLLRTEDDLITEVMHELGLQRRGTRIVAAVTASIRRVRSE